MCRDVESDSGACEEAIETGIEWAVQWTEHITIAQLAECFGYVGILLSARKLRCLGSYLMITYLKGFC